MYMPFEAE